MTTERVETKGFLDNKGGIHRSKKAAVAVDLHNELKVGHPSNDLVNRLTHDKNMRQNVIALLQELESDT